MAAFHKKHRSNVDLVLEDSETTTAHGGVLIIDALAKDFGLWKKIGDCRLMDPRKDKSRGFSPEVLAAQFIFSACSGGVSLADAGRLAGDKALGRLVGLERLADESTLGEWLRGQTQQSLDALWVLIRELVAWILEKAKPGRVREGGKLDVFFDDTQIEVDGRCFKGTALNYEGEISYSWQTFWLSQFIVHAAMKSGNTEASACLPECLEATVGLWEKDAEEGKVHFYADSASSAGKYLNLVDKPQWSWSISYNKWTEKLDSLAAEMDEKQWSKVREVTGRDGKPQMEQFGWVKHLPGEECQQAQWFAVVRYKSKAQDELFWRYAYVVCRGGRQNLWPTHQPESALRVFERHHLKGAKEQGFHQLLGDLDLHHPPCKEALANEFYYALTSLSFNLLMGIKVLYLDDDQQSWTVKTLIGWWLTVPVKLAQHAHRIRARIFVPKASLRWWRLFIQEKYPRRKPGRPVADESTEFEFHASG